MANFTVVIPARFASTRLPGKPLLSIAEKPLIQHVYEAAEQSLAASIMVATDDERIFNAVTSFGGRAIMTSEHHASGTDRIQEVIEQQGEDIEDIVVNLQGDEFGMSPMVINQVAKALASNLAVNMSTICELLEDPTQIHDPNVVKVVMDEQNQALYFSRAPIPWDRDGNSGDTRIRQYYRHIGLYAYRKDFLKRFQQMSRCQLEIVEALEQLRPMYHGEKIQVAVALESTGMGIDTEADLEKAREINARDK